jgi:hypothetical protein
MNLGVSVLEYPFNKSSAFTFKHKRSSNNIITAVQFLTLFYKMSFTLSMNYFIIHYIVSSLGTCCLYIYIQH